LALNRDRVASLARGISDDQAIWKPDKETWSILEVICHLADEEEYDFPVRLKIILDGDEKNWPEIDPGGWVTERKYNEEDLFESLNRYMELRNDSLEWLDSLHIPDWEASFEAPFGAISAVDMYASWVTHDLLHIRQLVELQRAYLEEKVKSISMDYAGEW
jgi:hypothetical protein